MKKTKSRRIGLILAGLALIGLIAVTGLALRPAPDPFQGAAVTDPPFPSLTYSIQGFFWWDEGHTGTQLDWVQLMAFNTIKQTFAWRDLEPEPGQWDFSQSDRLLGETERRGLHVVARLGQVPEWAVGVAIDDSVRMESNKHDIPPANLEDWADYCGTLAERYAGRIHAYQIWNEPNLSREWGSEEPDATAYTELLAACSEAIRATDPEAIIISAGLAPTGTHSALAHRDDIYLDALYRAGFQQYIDVVGVHAPGYAPPAYGPDDAERDGQGRWATFRRVEDLRKIMIEHDDAARQMAILEMGYTTDPNNPDYAWFAVTPEQQAEYLVEAFEYASEHWRPWVGLMSIIYLPKPTWTEQNEEYWWSIVLPGGLVRPAFGALASMPKVCGDFTIPYRPPDHPEFAEDLDVPASTCP